jgi:hypothetical protein
MFSVLNKSPDSSFPFEYCQVTFGFIPILARGASPYDFSCLAWIPLGPKLADGATLPCLLDSRKQR